MAKNTRTSTRKTVKKTYTGKNRQEPLLTRQEYKNKRYLSLAETAGLYNKTIVRIWQLINSGVVKAEFDETDKRRTGIRVPKSEMKVVEENLRNPERHYAD